MRNVISNVEIYGLEESGIASGYSMVADPEDAKFSKDRFIRLGGSTTSGHDQFLVGCHVDFDLTLSIKAWVQAERYKFLDFVSSQSTMHRISEFKLAESCVDEVTETTKQEIERLRQIYLKDKSKENYLTLLYNIPSGFRYTARMSTNYRCLINIYNQRKDHMIPEWHEVCNWIKTLPHMKEILKRKYMITPQHFADFTGMYIFMDEDRNWYMTENKPDKLLSGSMYERYLDVDEEDDSGATRRFIIRTSGIRISEKVSNKFIYRGTSENSLRCPHVFDIDTI